MGCVSSKKNDVFITPPGQGPTINGGPGTEDRLLPASKRPMTLEEARNTDDASRPPRLSVKYQARELSGRGASRRSSAPFDRARIGTHTRHGLMPGPRGFSAAKINQDRGVVCWPFNGSYNQALLCVFDGHGSKGERASEFCMRTIPDLLEADSTLRTDPTGCLSRNVIKTDEMLLGHAELGRFAMTCGTTSTVVYFNGPDCYVACSGDSRCVRGVRRGGKLVAEDLSDDHKPDLPQEKQRIIANGGSVTDGSAGRPARVWAHGRIGLAMSRSIGDGECKHVGVIPDPEIKHVKIAAAPADGGDGDVFIIVASDGVWEFITSDEACEIVSKHKAASDACSALVLEAALRWKRYEGSYRDDITCIVAYFPFLEDSWPEEPVDESETAADDEATSAGHVFINMGSSGIEVKDALPEEDEEGEGGGENVGEDSFAARRLSVHNPYDEDWNDAEEGADAPDDADDK